MKIEKNDLVILSVQLLLLGIIIYLSGFVRWSTMAASTILDYDPWWYYRHAIEIMNNNMIPPKWDILSTYPPGRLYDYQLGWEYTMIIFYKIAQFFSSAVSFLYMAKLSPLIMVALGAISAFLLGRMISNNWGGLFTALFVVLTPTFIGVSMAGYTDNDPVVVFYMFLCILSVFLALKKRSITYYVFAILTNLIFVFNWGGGWFVSMLFLAFLPTLAAFRFLERSIHERRISFRFNDIWDEIYPMLLPLAIIILFTNILAILSGFENIVQSLFVSLGFINPSQGLLVNISVAELQSINIFTSEGFNQVATRIGLAPFLITLIGLPAFALYKIYKKIKISLIEVFLFLWVFITFYMILHGVRFSLLFSIAASAAAGYVIGNVISLFKKDFDNVQAFMWASMLGLVLLLTLRFVSDAIQIGYSYTGMEVSKNWLDALDWLKNNADKDALITTWWDPGHIITGYAGLKVHADGAHCGPVYCYPYFHNDRIQDMGFVFSTSNESQAVDRLKKYMALTPEQCQEAREKFGSIMPADACKPVSEMYVIASSDLIGKYYWLSCFATYETETEEPGALCYLIPIFLVLSSGIIGYLLVRSRYKSFTTKLIIVGFIMIVILVIVWVFIIPSLSICVPSLKMKGCQGRNFAQLSFSNQDKDGNVVYGDGVIILTVKDDKVVSILNLPQQGIRNAIVKDTIYYQNGQMVKSEYTNATNMVDGMVFVDPSFQAVIFMDGPTRDSIFTKMFFFNGQGLKSFEPVYINNEVRIFKVIFS